MALSLYEIPFISTPMPGKCLQKRILKNERVITTLPKMCASLKGSSEGFTVRNFTAKVIKALPSMT